MSTLRENTYNYDSNTPRTEPITSNEYKFQKRKVKRGKRIEQPSFKKQKGRNNGISFNNKDHSRSKLRSTTSKKSGLSSKKSLSRGRLQCLIHRPTSELKSFSCRKGEIYRDSKHRNRKHEKEHLLHSFQQQSRSRKELFAKIARKGY